MFYNPDTSTTIMDKSTGRLRPQQQVYHSNCLGKSNLGLACRLQREKYRQTRTGDFCVVRALQVTKVACINKVALFKSALNCRGLS